MKKIIYLLTFLFCFSCLKPDKKKYEEYFNASYLPNVILFSNHEGDIYKVIFEPGQHKTLPADIHRYFPDLEELIFSDNQVEIIPNSVAFLKRLKILKGSNNKYLKTIPNLGLLEKLEELDLNRTDLSSIKHIDWHKLSRLKILKLSSSLQVDKDFADIILSLKQISFLQLDPQIESKIITKTDLTAQDETIRKIFLKITSTDPDKDVLPEKEFPVVVSWGENKKTICSEFRDRNWSVEIDLKNDLGIGESSFKDNFTKIELAFLDKQSCDPMPTDQPTTYPISAYLFLKN